MSDVMSDDELEAIRAYAEHHGVKPWTEHIFRLLDEVSRLRDLVGEPYQYLFPKGGIGTAEGVQ